MYPKDIVLFAKYQDCQFMHFMKGLCEGFESTRASLLSESHTSSLKASIKELISKENRRPIYHMSSSDHVLATPSPPLQPPISAFIALP